MNKILLFVLLFLISSLVYSTDSGSLYQRSELTGNWFGQRFSLAEQGITIEASSINDLMSNVRGGLQKHTAFLGNVNVVATIDLDNILGVREGILGLNVLGLTGNSFSDFVGDAQVVSNIDAPNTWKLYEAWYEQSFSGGSFSILGGLYDLNSEFDVIESAGLFINSSFGIGADISQTGENGPSIFPTTSPGLRLNWRPNENTYLQTVVLDAIAGDPENPYGTQIHFNPDDGWLYVMEMGFLSDNSNSFSNPYQKIALGSWFYTSEFEEFSHPEVQETSLSSSNNQGFYILGERSVYKSENNPENFISIFGRYGIANSDLNQFDYYAGAGIVFNNLIPVKYCKQLGIAVARAHNSKRFLQCMQFNGCELTSAETVIEMTLKSEIFPWLSVQPDFQYIIDPGTQKQLGDALVVGLRTEIIY